MCFTVSFMLTEKLSLLWRLFLLQIPDARNTINNLKRRLGLYQFIVLCVFWITCVDRPYWGKCTHLCKLTQKRMSFFNKRIIFLIPVIPREREALVFYIATN